MGEGEYSHLFMTMVYFTVYCCYVVVLLATRRSTAHPNMVGQKPEKQSRFCFAV
jgi:hypothetical protein